MSTPPEDQPQQTWWAVPSRVLPQPGSGTNGQAVAAFVLGLLAVVPVSVVLAIVALVRIGRTRQRGKGLAIAGLVLSGAWLLVGVGGVVTAVMYASSHATAGSPFAPGARTLDQLAPGTCFNRPAGSAIQWVSEVPCTQSHDGQFLASSTEPFTSYPGLDQAKSDSFRVCLQAEYAAFPDVAMLPVDSVVHYSYPTQQTWDGGLRQVRCFIGFAAGSYSEPLTRPRTYPAATLAFLKLEQARQIPARMADDLTDDEWSTGLALAPEIAAADRAEAAWLDNRSGPFAGSGNAKTLAAEDLTDAALWDAVGSASDASSWGSLSTDERQAEVLRSSDVDAMRSDVGLPYVPAIPQWAA
ncbi:DUF4190 domain-containing protein [Streptacidiphilus sp. EB129]|uniref:DUF4190 domain-containing protein n=1 Tax=Streptacidiphilus sp. EB129 TaxID=3156262 RepID=UPI003515AE63